jgi:beta-N-acetylhexosaminidase
MAEVVYKRSGSGGREALARAPMTALVVCALLALVACGAEIRTPATVALGAGAQSHVSSSVHPWQLSPDMLAAQMVGRMSLDDKLGQMIIIQFTQQDYTADQAQLVRPYHPGGVILYSYAMGTAQQVKNLLAGAQKDSPIPMLTMTDLEGGWIDHLAQYVGPHMSAPAMAASGNPAVATQQGSNIAHDLLSFGFNTDLAPDVDVELVAGPDQIGRTFGSAPQPVITYGGAFVDGLQQSGVAGCLKHFPGLGAATTDAHADLPVINRSRDELEATEFAPYRALIASGQAQMIMSTDVLMPALDPTMPAEISRPIVTGILRNELHFDGVAITDALYMKGIQDKYYFALAAELAIEAGNDMIMAPFTPGMMDGIFAHLKAALADGRLSMSQVDNSVRRILALKLRYHLLPLPRPIAPGLSDLALGGEQVADLPHPAPLS